jgi:hypothetical protein
MKLVPVAAVFLLMAPVFVLGGCGSMFGRPKLIERELKVLGRVKVPPRLEGPGNSSSPAAFRFSFARYYPWWDFRAIGSNTPIREELAIEVTPARTATPLSSWAVAQAAKTVQVAGKKEPQLAWRREPPFEVTEGIYTTNMQARPVFVLVMPLPEKNAVIAYRVRRSDSSLQEAKRLLSEVAASLVIAGTVPELFASEKARPEREYQEHLATVRAGLAKHGLELPPFGEMREQKGYYVHFINDGPELEGYVLARKLAERRLAAPAREVNPEWTFEYPRDTRPQFLYPVGWYINVGGEWKWGGQNRLEPPSEPIDQRIRATLADPLTVYFYAVRKVWIRREAPSAIDPSWWISLIPATEKKFAQLPVN